ncbi:nucleotidyltransferase [Reyranella sp.]|uniref:nucleotidyltransferase domain-containing protein n=1 Tax=Reyranella sp. TaxID=1929291 RepID=UPI00272F3CD6|nr:nucleotidyltransferase [Reyranella sp.]MDP2374401.1 nucleotidyltransferase [Reyranella sp.]
MPPKYPAAEFDPFAHPLDALLADIAINIQLPPGLHEKANNRYEAVRAHAERPGSPLAGVVKRFYPQGSMLIDATISTRGTDDEYDLDIVAELDLPPHSAPNEPLDLLMEALKDYPVQKVIRQTRCVTLSYADRMHLDVTPASRLPLSNERESHIFHAKAEEHYSKHFHVPMNAWGFGTWYTARTPLEYQLAKALNRRLLEAYGMEIAADAEVDDVPGQAPITFKNTATVALQLLKRFRNIQYATYKGRVPPSVMLSCFAGHAATLNISLSGMVIRIARSIARAIGEATRRGQKLSVVNPVYLHDCFTDRWPENIDQQDEFAERLTGLADGLEALQRREAPLEELQDWLREQFGDLVVSRSVQQFNKRAGRAIQDARQVYRPSGQVYVPSRPAIIAGVGAAAASRPASAAIARPHTFRGQRRR